MSKARQILGRIGEDLAARHLESCGYRLVERNYRCSTGEMDIVARDGEYIAFVEVRTRRSRSHGTPEESVTPRKQRKLAEVAMSYLAERGLGEVDWRIDVVAIEMTSDGQVRRLNHIRSAVGADTL